MKPIIKKKLAIFPPQGFLDGGNARSVITGQDINLITSSRCEVVLVSLKRIIFFNKRGLSTVLEQLQIIGNVTGAMIGFCDYDNKKFNMIMDMYNKRVPFSLFDTEAIGGLFANPPKDPHECKILIYSNNKEQKNQISMELLELGYKPKTAKDNEEYLALKDDGYKYLIRHSRLGTFSRIIQVHIKKNSVIYTLKDFLDSSLADDFDMLHHQNAIKLGFSFYLFEASKVSSVNVHAVNFISKLSTAGAEHGVSISVCGLTEHSITQTLKNDLEDAGVLLYKDLNEYFSDTKLLGDDSGGVMSHPKNITKKLVEILPLITEVSLKMIGSMTHEKLQKTSIKIQDLDLTHHEEVFAVAIAFYGQIEGMMVLCFDKNIAKKVCAVLLDESYGDDDLLDCLCELINMIGGKLIAKLKTKNIQANITMPRAYKDVQDVLEHKKNTKGAQVNFELNGTNLTLFLTK